MATDRNDAYLAQILATLRDMGARMDERLGEVCDELRAARQPSPVSAEPPQSEQFEVREPEPMPQPKRRRKRKAESEPQLGSEDEQDEDDVPDDDAPQPESGLESESPEVVAQPELSQAAPELELVAEPESQPTSANDDDSGKDLP